MSFASCEKCWDDTCSCGWKYRDWDGESIRHFLVGLLKHNPLADDVFTLKDGE